MDDPVRLIVYVIMGLAWFFLSAKGRQGGEPDEKPWEELPPILRPRRAPTKPLPTETSGPPKRIVIGPPKKQAPTVAAPRTAVAEALQTLAAERSKAPAPTLTITSPAIAAAPGWSFDLSSQKGIAEGIILSAILGPPKASAYLRRVTRYWGVPS